MNRHTECLLDVCRLCAEHRAALKGRNPLPKEQFATVIDIALNVSVGDDVNGVHPPYICKSCELKLRRWRENHAKRKRATCNIDVATFTEKSCEKCCGEVHVNVTLDDHRATAEKFALLTWRGEDRVRAFKVDAMGDPIVYFTILADFAWFLSVSGVSCRVDHPLCLDVPEFLSLEDTFVMCSKIEAMHPCVGNPDFPELVEVKSGPEGQVPSQITSSDVFVNRTIRHKKCHLLIQAKSSRCEFCKVHRGDLSSASSRAKVKERRSGSASSNAPNTSLSKQQLQEKVVDLQSERRSLMKRKMSLESKVATMMKEESVSLSPLQQKGMEEAFAQLDESLTSDVVQDNPVRLLVDQQRAALQKGKQMRWHPAILRWCIAVQSKSSSAYNVMRDSGFLRLPHPSTLHRYTHFADAKTGFNSSLLERIVAENGISGNPEESHNVCLLFDEMKVKSGLVYSVRSGQIIGFCDVGDIANEVSRFERRCRGEEESELASHVLVVMVRGIDSSLHSPVAVFPTTGVTSEQLFPCLWECVRYVETAGMAVRAFVSDGASANWKFYRLHVGCGQNASGIFYSTTNPVDPSRQIYFICDVPHLLKTTRNNFENSGYNNNTRKLFYNKQQIKWTHLLNVYEWDIGLKRTSPGLRMLHKISYEHLHLTPSLRMRVYLAAQILSSTMANAVEAHGQVGTTSTVKFIRMFDQFFDCLNVSNIKQGKRTRKTALAPYTSVDDWRFAWLKEDFLGFLMKWENEVKCLPNVNDATRKKMCLSAETLEGLRITVHSFVELAKTLLSTTKIKFVLSEKLNQDPLEEYFSKQRGSGGSWDNPTVEQFSHNMLALHVASSSIKASKKGNVRKQNQGEGGFKIDSTPLPKRK